MIRLQSPTASRFFSSLMLVFILVLGLIASLPQTVLASSSNEINGVAWVDTNGDGLLSSNETQLLSHVVITLTDFDGTIVATTTTNNVGAYFITAPGAGTYFVSAGNVDKMLTSTPSQRQVSLTPDQSSEVDFGFVPASSQLMVSLTAITDRSFVEIVWQTGNENELTGFNVYRSNADGSNFTRLTSQPISLHGAHAPYSFSTLPPTSGSYLYWVEFSTSVGPVLYGPRSAQVDVSQTKRLFVPILGH